MSKVLLVRWIYPTAWFTCGMCSHSSTQLNFSKLQSNFLVNMKITCQTINPCLCHTFDFSIQKLIFHIWAQEEWMHWNMIVHVCKYKWLTIRKNVLEIMLVMKLGTRRSLGGITQTQCETWHLGHSYLTQIWP